jgi:hypothetical protein
MKTKTCLFTCIQPGEIACGAAVSLDRTLLCDLEEFCDGLQLHGSRPLASKRDEIRSVTGCAQHAHVFFWAQSRDAPQSPGVHRVLRLSAYDGSKAGAAEARSLMQGRLTANRDRAAM